MPHDELGGGGFTGPMQMMVLRTGPNVVDWSAVCTSELVLPAVSSNEMSLGKSVENKIVAFAAAAGTVVVPVGVA